MNDSRKIMIHRRDPMSRQSLKMWSPHLRNKIRQYVFRNLGSRQIPYYFFETRQTFAEWIKSNFGFGYFYVYLWREGYYKKRSIKRLRPYLVAVIKIKENGVDFVDLGRISRYNWFEPKKKSIIQNYDVEVI